MLPVIRIIHRTMASWRTELDILFIYWTYAFQIEKVGPAVTGFAGYELHGWPPWINNRGEDMGLGIGGRQLRCKERAASGAGCGMTS
jgi:hypothetical protein